MERYILALEDAWEKLQANPASSAPETQVYAAMNIVVTYRGIRGISFQHQHGRIVTRKALDEVLHELRRLDQIASDVRRQYWKT